MNTIYPNMGFNFQILLDNETYNFKEVSGMSSETTNDEITEGGENRYKYKIPSDAKYNNLELKKGLVPKNSNLFLWLNNCFSAELNEPIKPKTVEISLLNESGNKVMSWDFIEVWPVGCNSTSFNSLDNEIVIESIKFSYNYFANKIIK